MSQQVREHGVIKRLLSEKGYGFITSAEGGSVFIHRSQSEETVFDSLRVGDKVSYVTETADKGTRGVDVQVA